MQYRQGDILLIEINEIPVGARLVSSEGEDRLILARGEATGHHHSLATGSARLMEFENDTFVEVVAQAMLVHQEHAAITLPVGSYQLVRQREYTPERIRIVAD